MISQFPFPHRSSAILLLGAALLVGCGTRVPTASPGQASTSGSAQLEAEGAQITELARGEFQAQTVVEPGAPSGGQVVSDPAASGGKAVDLLSNGNAVRFSVPSNLGTGNYSVAVQAKAEPYNGNPVLALRVNGSERARAEITGTSYAAFSFGTFSLKPGDTLEVVFVNDAYAGPGKDRNVAVDHLIVNGSGATAPAPTPSPTPAPTTTPTVNVGNATDVKSFGARGDGQSDDTDALRRAVASGKSLYFPAGTYRVSRVITLSGLNGQTISGQGATLQATSNFTRDGDNAVLFIKNSRNVTVQGLNVTGHRPGATSAGLDIDGVRVTGGGGVTLRDMKIRAVPTNGVTILDTSDFTLQNSSVGDVGRHGMWSARSSNVRVIGNTLTGSGAPTGSAPGGLGLLASQGNTFLAENNRFLNWSNTATKTEAIDNTTYRGNTVDVFGKDGIKVMPLPSGGPQVRNAVIENNTISGYRGWDNTGSGSILVQAVDGGRVSGNTVQGSGGTYGTADEDGIRVNSYGGSDSRNIEVRDNTVRNAKTGLRLMSDSITVSGNRIQATGYAAVLDGTGLRLTNNPELRGGAGITVLYDQGAQADMTGNSLYGNDIGIYAANSGNRGRIAGNTFASSYRKQVAAGSGVSYTP